METPIVNVGYASTNYYAIKARGSYLLVDVGWPGTLPKLRHSLDRVGIALNAVGHLLVTHYHPDHAGLAQELKREGVRLIVLEPQIPAVRGVGAGRTFRPRGRRVSPPLAPNRT